MSELYRSMRNDVAINVLCRIQVIHLSQQHCSKELYAATVCECVNWAIIKMDYRKRNTKEYSPVWKLWRRCIRLLESRPLSDICFRDESSSWHVRKPEPIVTKVCRHLCGKHVPEFQPKS